MIESDILDVSDALDEWLQPVTIKTVTTETVNFVKSETVTGRTQQCVIQQLKQNDLIKRQLDVKLRHIRAHSCHAIDAGELIEFKGKDYRVLHPSEWTGYGYTEVDAVETKQPLKVPN